MTKILHGMDCENKDRNISIIRRIKMMRKNDTDTGGRNHDKRSNRKINEKRRSDI